MLNLFSFDVWVVENGGEWHEPFPQPFLAGMNGSPPQMLIEFFPKSQGIHTNYFLQTSPGENVDEGAKAAAKIYIMKCCNHFSF